MSENNAIVVSAELGVNGFLTKMTARRHKVLADEPVEVGGEDVGPTPKEYLCMSLASCVLITLRMYAERKKWDIGKINIEVRHFREEDESGDLIDCFEKRIAFSEELDEKRLKRLMTISDKCPVNKLLKNGAHIGSVAV